MRAFILVFMADNDMWQSTSGNTGRAGSNRGGNVGAPIYGSGATRNAEGTSGTTLFDRVPPHDVDAEMAVPVSYTHLTLPTN